MGQVESKVFVSAPPWDLDEIGKTTDLDKATINALWRQWATDPLTKKGKVKFDAFAEKLQVDVNEENEVLSAHKIFNLIDEDDDGKVEFPDVCLFLFSLEEKVSELLCYR